MSRILILASICVWAALPPQSLPAVTLFVAPGGNNGNSGTSAGQAWATLQHAAENVSPGDTVSVTSGTYTGFHLVTSGTMSSPISFLAEPGVIINADNPVTIDGINLEGASHIVIDGFTVTGATRAGIRSVVNEHVTIRNNVTDLNGRWGIFTGFSNDLLIENNQASRSQVEHGIYVSNSGDRPTIRNNAIWGNNANGIHMNGDLSAGGDGIITDALVENNTIFNNGVAGGSGINGDGVVNARIVNNLLYNNHASGISLYQIDGGAPSTGGQIINNTIINADDARWVINLRNGAAGATVFNNILFNLNDSSFRGTIAALEGSDLNLVSDFNLLDPRFSLEDDSAAIGFASWQLATGNDANSSALTLAQMQALFADYSQQDFTLAETSLARDFGAAALLNGSLIDAPDADLLGAARPFGAGIDAGAYEFQVVPEPEAVTLALIALLMVVAMCCRGRRIVPMRR